MLRFICCVYRITIHVLVAADMPSASPRALPLSGPGITSATRCLTRPLSRPAPCPAQPNRHVGHARAQRLRCAASGAPGDGGKQDSQSTAPASNGAPPIAPASAPGVARRTALLGESGLCRLGPWTLWAWEGNRGTGRIPRPYTLGKSSSLGRGDLPRLNAAPCF